MQYDNLSAHTTWANCCFIEKDHPYRNHPGPALPFSLFTHLFSPTIFRPVTFFPPTGVKQFQIDPRSKICGNFHHCG